VLDVFAVTDQSIECPEAIEGPSEKTFRAKRARLIVSTNNKTMPGRTTEQDHYDVLALTPPHSTHENVTDQDVKLAYRCALLLHHPDKSKPSQASRPTVDQITLAYKTLLNPTTRAEHDRLQALKFTSTAFFSQASHPGLETVDLDELLYDEGEGVWYRGCRCGKERAYVVTEEELEANVGHGELATGCQGCSLWLKVTFAVAEDG